jgi:PKD repeat protein
MKKISLPAIVFLLMVPAFINAQRHVASDPANGDWTEQYVILTNTPEADLMVRTGDIDNLGFGWPTGFDPFTGGTTPSHAYPWTVKPEDAPGTDRIMVISSYTGTPPHGADGYTSTTSRPANLPVPIVLNFALAGLQVNNAVLQIFVDDFQAPVWHADYFVELNGQQAPYMATVVNGLSQTGPVGKMISFNIPEEHLGLLQRDSLSVFIDDVSTGAGDGYAIDFVKLLVNTTGYTHTGSVHGKITDRNTGNPVPEAVVFTPATAPVLTDASGNYIITGIPAGLTRVQASKFGYDTAFAWLDLQSGQSVLEDMQIAQVLDAEFTAEPLSGTFPLTVQFTDLTTKNPNTWFWDFGDQSGIYGHIRNPQHTFFTRTGSFTVELIASNGTETNKEIKVAYIKVWGVGVDEHQTLTGLSVNPNPVASYATVIYDLAARAEVEFGLSDHMGRQVKYLPHGVQEPGKNGFMLDFSDLAAGLYFLQARSGGHVLTARVVVAK